MELKKIHEDRRGAIYLVENLLDGGREYTFMEINKGYARGGCLHSKDENFVVVKGRVEVICGDSKYEAKQGESGIFPAYQPHAFVALEDSIVSEWGITTQEKEMDKKDPELRGLVDRLNSK